MLEGRTGRLQQRDGGHLHCKGWVHHCRRVDVTIVGKAKTDYSNRVLTGSFDITGEDSVNGPFCYC